MTHSPDSSSNPSSHGDDLVLLLGRRRLIMATAAGNRLYYPRQIAVQAHTQPHDVRRALQNLMPTQRPGRVLVSVERRASYRQLVSPTVDIVGAWCQQNAIPMVWFPDFTELVLLSQVPPTERTNRSWRRSSGPLGWLRRTLRRRNARVADRRIHAALHRVETRSPEPLDPPRL